MNCRLPNLALCALLAVSAPNALALDWPQSEVRRTVEAGTTGDTVSFPFRNTGEQTVCLIAIQPSCDCVSAKAAKMVYHPGESGSIEVTLDLAGRSGLQQKSITVVASDAPKKPTLLRLFVMVGEPVAISPSLLAWPRGGPIAGKSFDIRVAEPEVTSVDTVQCVEAGFAVWLEALAEAGCYRVHVKPVGTAQLAQATIRLAATVAGQSRVFVLQAVVR